MSLRTLPAAPRQEVVMADKVAGIDVHKKVLMVVVINARTPEEKPERRRFATNANRIAPLIELAAGTRGRRSGDGIDRAILAIGVDGVGTAHVPSSGASVFQPCSARTQA